ncbi:uncharacterized protein BJ171DRAFT_575670 [Polychytrium aggregatum]|uniref:uncharacterized protein n=1 Tax=Polychytrium aggregatum TaxID=110093 RepID=UPI0022FDC0AA|nr:uncharacterized protein BJ171DRAFT_575670 [Polychytrium aggregatum]KAI9188572.1 hypothetical protein BJ171DRAFT_575670 [Polychytrium aggregatum]
MLRKCIIIERSTTPTLESQKPMMNVDGVRRVTVATGNKALLEQSYWRNLARLRFARYFEQFIHHQRRPPDRSVSKIHVCSVNEFNTSQVCSVNEFNTSQSCLSRYLRRFLAHTVTVYPSSEEDGSPLAPQFSQTSPSRAVGL